ncbi:MAG TPA: NAD(P)-dependent oxidoreductase, partial [Gemmatimonadales bacterium]
MSRRLVVDLQSSRPLWRIPAGAVRAIHDALPGWDVVPVEQPATSDGDGGPGTPAAIAAARGAEIYLGFGVPSGVVAAGRETLRWAHTATAGAGAAIPNVRGTRIVLTNSAAVHAEPMADWVLAAILHFSRGLDRMVRAQADGRWAKDEFTDGTLGYPELRDLRVGIFGLGGVGAALARRATALGMSVAGVRRRPGAPGPAGLRWVGGFGDLGRLAAESDVFV